MEWIAAVAILMIIMLAVGMADPNGKDWY